MPMPVSATENASTSSASVSVVDAKRRSSGARPMARLTRPASVNFTAFESRFFSTCSSRCSSVKSDAGRSSATSTANSSPFCSASGRNVRSANARSSVSGTSAGLSSIFPASTFERSRMSLMSSSRSVPALWIVPANSSCLSVRFSSGLSRSSFARMSSEFSGVRSSWLMFARNSDL